MAISCDLCVIGAGSAGLSVAAAAAQFGERVVLIEKAAMGGDCLNFGCVPSKAMIAAARHAHCAASGEPFGIAAAAPKVDFAAVQDHVQAGDREHRAA
jgi:pyruvate/2-oxoglutarate dehydrogenase complex dihydrolipoamide dehydrogenase (E3) component